MPSARIKAGETKEEARLRYNSEMRAYRQLRKSVGKPLGERTPEEVFRHGLWKKYKLREADYLALRIAQNNSCKICNLTFADRNVSGSGKYNCVVDHCHATGKVRGLLCSHCNLGLGHFFDNTRLLTAAITYLA